MADDAPFECDSSLERRFTVHPYECLYLTVVKTAVRSAGEQWGVVAGAKGFHFVPLEPKAAERIDTSETF